MKSPQNLLAATGLALGAVFGMAGTFVGSPSLRAAFWAIDGVGLIVATALLSLMYLKKGNDLAAAGFLVYSIGEAVMLTGTATPLEASVPSFAAGISLWSAALLLLSIPRQFAIWVRITGIIAAVLFGITAARIFWGTPLLPTAAPLPSLGYPFLVLTFIGWIWTLLKTD